jgi:hypothetical protein
MGLGGEDTKISQRKRPKPGRQQVENVERAPPANVATRMMPKYARDFRGGSHNWATIETRHVQLSFSSSGNCPVVTICDEAAGAETGKVLS